MSILPLNRDNVWRVIRGLQGFFKGLDEEIEVYVASQIAGLPTLLIGGHGTGKTTLVKAFYNTLVVREKEGYRPLKVFAMLLKERHTPMDVFYSYDLPALMQGREKIVPKAIDAEAVFLDEVFANQLVLSALKDFLEERVYDRYRARWLFFTGGTNPPNQYYQTVLQLTNLADLDRFDVTIPVESRLGVDLFEIAEAFAEADDRRPEPSIKAKLDVSSIREVRKQIFSIPVENKAKSMVTLFAHVYNACIFEDEDKERHFVDKFSVLSEIPCPRCTFRGHLCSKFAIAPTRLIRSTLSLAKALAWLYGKKTVTHDLALKALKYTLPLRLVVIDEAYKTKLASLKEASGTAVKEFTKWFTDHEQLFKGFKKCVSLLKQGKYSDATKRLSDLAYMYNNDPIALSLIHSFEQGLGRACDEIESALKATNDVNLLRRVADTDNDFKEIAEKRLKEALGLTVVVLEGDDAKKVLNTLFKRGFIGVKEFDAMCITLAGFYNENTWTLRDDLKVTVKVNKVVLEGSREALDRLLK